VKAAVLRSANQPLQIEDVPRPVPADNHLLLRVLACGVCRTDLHIFEGDLPLIHQPLIPGHQIVGEIVEGATPDRPLGMRVGVSWIGGTDGTCLFCRRNEENLCDNPIFTGYTVDGGYAEYVRANASFVGRVPDGVDPLDAAPLSCAGVTTYKAVKVSGARSSDLVAIYGIGGLGHLALQYARIAGASVAAVDLVDSKLVLARELGAEHTTNSSVDDPVEAIQSLGGADVAIAVAVSPVAFEQAFRSLKRGGTLVFVALPADNYMRLPIFETVLQGITVVGSIVGTRVDLAQTFELHAEGRTRVVRESRQLEQVNDAFEQIEKGVVDARLVFDLR
jgi:alcohol dehydrogenase, propanol-preferring